jgi:hypothetical protein
LESMMEMGYLEGAKTNGRKTLKLISGRIRYGFQPCG